MERAEILESAVKHIKSRQAKPVLESELRDNEHILKIEQKDNSK